MTLEKCPYSSGKIKDLVKSWESLESAPVRRLILLEADFSHSQPNVILVQKDASDEVYEKILGECIRDVILHLETKVILGLN